MTSRRSRNSSDAARQIGEVDELRGERHRQPFALHAPGGFVARDDEPARLAPRAQPLRRLDEQRRIVVDQQPLLLRLQALGQIARVGAGAGADVEHREVGLGREPRRHDLEQTLGSRRGIGRLPQRQPLGV